MKLLFAGDVMLGRIINDILKRKPPAYVWGDTVPIFQSADVRICNLECVISDNGQPTQIVPKAFHFRSDAKNVEVLKIAGINLVSLANNHALDFEYDALSEMIHVLDKAGIAHAGAGANALAASKPAIIMTKGQKVGFIAFTDNEPLWEATKHYHRQNLECYYTTASVRRLKAVRRQ